MTYTLRRLRLTVIGVNEVITDRSLHRRAS